MLSRRRFLQLTGTALATAPLLTPRRAWARPLDFQALRRNVGVFTERGGTIGWLANDDALVIVDTQFPETAATCWTGLQERTARTAADLVINTHHHGDHTSGNPFFIQHTDRLVAHENVPRLLRQSADDGETPTVPNETFATDWSETVGDETIRLRYHGPAHTGGDSVIHFEQANVVHMGDLVFNRLYPYIDVNGGASTRGWIDVLEQVHADFDDDTRFIFGHGNAEYGITGDRADLLAMRDFLSALLEYVQQGISAGQALDAMADRQTLPGFEEYYVEGRGLTLGRCVRAVHQDLTSS